MNQQLQVRFIIKFIMSAYRRLQAEIEASRRMDLEISRRIQIQRLERQRQYLRLKDIEKVRAQQQFQQFRLRRAQQHWAAEQQILQERALRQAACRQYQNRVQNERIARQARDKQLQIQQRLDQEDQIRKAEILAVSRRADLDRKQKIKADIDRENLAILDEQKVQQKLEKELHEIDIKIGTIYDERENRKRQELLQLEDLDKESFRLKQAMRSSKVQQKALQQSLAELSKLIV